MKKLFLIGLSLALLAALGAGIAFAQSNRAVIQRTSDGAQWLLLDTQGDFVCVLAPTMGVITPSANNHWTWRSTLDFNKPLQVIDCETWENLGFQTLDFDVDYVCSHPEYYDAVFGDGFTDAACRGNGALIIDDNFISPDTWTCVVDDQSTTKWHITMSDSGRFSAECQFSGSMP